MIVEVVDERARIAALLARVEPVFPRSPAGMACRRRRVRSESCRISDETNDGMTISSRSRTDAGGAEFPAVAGRFPRPNRVICRTTGGSAPLEVVSGNRDMSATRNQAGNCQAIEPPVTRLAWTTKTRDIRRGFGVIDILRHDKLSVCQLASVLNIAPSPASGPHRAAVRGSDHGAARRQVGLLPPERRGSLRRATSLRAGPGRLRQAGRTGCGDRASPEWNVARLRVRQCQRGRAGAGVTTAEALIMDWRREWNWLVAGVGWVAAIFGPAGGNEPVRQCGARVGASARVIRREHLLLCLVPASSSPARSRHSSARLRS